MSSQILLVEDEDKTARDLARGLRGEGHDVEVATTEQLDLAILDVRRPGRERAPAPRLTSA